MRTTDEYVRRASLKIFRHHVNSSVCHDGRGRPSYRNLCLVCLVFGLPASRTVGLHWFFGLPTGRTVGLHDAVRIVRRNN
jgi:hypothetical protein